MTHLTLTTNAIRHLLSELFCDKEVSPAALLRELESLQQDIGYYIELTKNKIQVPE